MDVLTIGAGGGAYPAAFRLAKAGKSVIMTDPKGVMSGNCLYEGCVPSKAIRETGEILENQRRFANLGLPGQIAVDFAKIIAHKDAIQARRYAQHEKELKEYNNLELINGIASFIDPYTILVNCKSGIQRTFKCRHIIIASGSDVFTPAIPGVKLCLTSHDIYKPDPTLKILPKRMVVIGGGYIGLETASFFATFGTKVTLLQRSSQVLSSMDPDMVSTLTPLLHKDINILVNTTIERIESTGSVKQVFYRQDGIQKQVEAEVIVMATGRKAVIPEGTKQIGIEVDNHGIVVGPSLQTRFGHIYATGDVNGRVPLFHAAVRQSLVASHNILGGDKALDYADFVNIPTTIFTLPCAAYIGLTATQARKQGLQLITGQYNFSEDSRAQILETMGGGIRLFFTPGNLRIVGAWIVGTDAGLLIGQIGLAVAKGLTAYDLAAFADQHPMSSEGICHAARSIF